ncbi:hypothetical protein E2C01_024570 [Portunus trituberculatus]|uniref:Uncharacterized protein n=1 Tax=Portunus trituberculatus TaxID=210409 RepID=A0A5B7ED29_PORTR|nr:hypothetical protein [Portunus trituberculatus]
MSYIIVLDESTKSIQQHPHMFVSTSHDRHSPMARQVQGATQQHALLWTVKQQASMSLIAADRHICELELTCEELHLPIKCFASQVSSACLQHS